MRGFQVLVGTSSVLVEEMRPEATTRIRAAKMGRTPLGMPTNAQDWCVSLKDKLEDRDKANATNLINSIMAQYLKEFYSEFERL